MNSFSVHGRWFLPGSEESSAAGTLTVDRERGLTLAITGGLGNEDLSWSMDVEPPVIWGVIEKPWRRHRFVTLANVARTQVTLAIPGFQSQEYRARTAYFADRNLPSQFQIRRCRVRLSDLDRWAGAGKPGWTDRLTLDSIHGVSYEKPAPLVARIRDDFALTLDYTVRSSFGRGRLFASEHAAFVGEWVNGIDKDDGTHSMIVPLAQLLTLLTDQPARVRDVSIFAEDAPNSPVYVVAQWTSNRNGLRTRRSGHKPEFLFRLSDVTLRFHELLTEWYALRSSHGAFMGALFGFIVAPPAFAEQKFLLMMHVMRLAALAGTPEDAGNAYATGTEATAWALGELRPTMSKALSALPETFLDELSIAEADVHAGRAVHGAKLVWFTETAKWLAKSYLLSQLGAVSNRADEILASNEEMRFALDRLGKQT